MSLTNRNVPSASTLNAQQVAQQVAQQAAQLKAMLDWINRVQAAPTPGHLCDLVYNRDSKDIPFLKPQETRSPIVSDILTCILTIKVWALHGEYLQTIHTMIDSKLNGDGTGVGPAYEKLDDKWHTNGLHNMGDMTNKGYITNKGYMTNKGHMTQLGAILPNYRKRNDLWTWTCEDKTVTADAAHEVISDSEMSYFYQIVEDTNSTLRARRYGINTRFDAVEKAQLNSSLVLKHYKAVYGRLRTTGKSIPEVAEFLKALDAQQARGQTPSDTTRGRPGSSSSRRSSHSASPSPSKGNLSK